jgi:cytochrome c556
MLVAMDLFEKALASKDEAKIKSDWAKVNDTCEKCHDVYD